MWFLQPALRASLFYDPTEKEQLDEEIAKALYIGIIHDTGVFQYSNTSPETLRAAAKLDFLWL